MAQEDEDAATESPSKVTDWRTGPDIDLYKAFVPGESRRERFSRWFRRLCYLDETSALARSVFRSDTAMKREMSRHISFFGSTVHPFSFLRFVWECVMIAVFGASFLVLPYDVTFLYKPEDYMTITWFHLIVLTVDVLCMVDICFTIRTGFYDKKNQHVELDPRRIANRYVRFWFWVDVISSAPDTLISRYVRSRPPLSYCFFDCLHKRTMHFGCLWDLINVLSLLKIFRIRTFLRYVNNVYKRYGFRRNVVKFTTIAVVITVTLHWMSCLMFLSVRIAQGADPELVDSHSWTKSRADIWDHKPADRYIECFFRTLYTVGLMTHSIDPFMTNEDIVMLLAASILGYILKIYLLAELLIFVRITFSSNNMYHEHRHELKNYILHEQLSPDLEARMLRYYDHRVANRYSRKRLIDFATSDQFHAPIRDEVCGALVAGVSLFHDTMTVEMIRKLLLAMQYQLYLKDDLIVSAADGSDGARMVFIIRGTVAIYTAAWREVLHLEDGEHFGEYQLVLGGDTMKYSNIVAVETSEIYVLDRNLFEVVLTQHPEVRERIINMARERYESLAALERDVVLETIDGAETVRRTRKFYE
ncbi:potassium/sodium hyperpolarization-activated cyclic nucleotide-gated channel 4 [Culex quinquefasciatus]|uniref:potassium/sodium hyperpolarization-activated cyclic nucleotide-gated channel 4 n=1 Tax=Culex quinquefasciatus TaxID=7176 RepID=UPI0018E30783|nr:potassium/sodium hyperpolarization-activated cyclic nucleotide-gated channel 4 [Culex quinquefasciatus]